MPVRNARSSRQIRLEFPPAESILGPVPLLEGEDRKSYNLLLKNVRAAMPPPNFLVDLSIQNVVYYTWLIARYQRFEIELSKELNDSEKTYRADPLTERSIIAQRMSLNRQAIAFAEERRFQAYRQIEYVCGRLAKTLRKALARSQAQLVETVPGGGEPSATSAA